MDLLASNRSIPQVLIVEDDPVSAMLITRLLAVQKIAVDRADDGAKALAMHRARPYRLVISDWMMPEMDGVQLCREFRKLTGPYVYFVLCSAKGQQADRVEAFEAGVDDFLSKPLVPDELHSRLTVARRILSTEDGLQRQKAELEQAGRLLQSSNESLRLASKRFADLFNGLPVACFTFDQYGVVQEWNERADQVFGFQAYEATQQPVWEIMNRFGETLWTPERIEEIFTGVHVPTFDWTFPLRYHECRYLAANVICLRDRDGKAIGAVCANVDVTERKLAEEQVRQFADKLEQQKLVLEDANVRLSHLAVTDGLTGLWNHRRFQEMLEEALEGIREKGAPFSLLLLDIDHFKKFNDDFGHQVGDEVLMKFARTLRQTSRTGELPARYGGEEFAVILQRCDLEGGILAAERFRQGIVAQEWQHRSVTASVGIATCIDPNTTGKELIAQADSALYFSKQNGRNRATHFDRMTPTIAA